MTLTSPLTDQANLTPEALMSRLRLQLDCDCDLGLFPRCPEEDLERVVSESVASLWAESRIKLYLPILALRRARKAIDEAADARRDVA